LSPIAFLGSHGESAGVEEEEGRGKKKKKKRGQFKPSGRDVASVRGNP